MSTDQTCDHTYQTLIQLNLKTLRMMPHLTLTNQPHKYTYQNQSQCQPQNPKDDVSPVEISCNSNYTQEDTSSAEISNTFEKYTRDIPQTC